MRGRDHDARVRAKVAHREGGERGRVGLGQCEDAHACCRGDTAGGRGELGGAVAGVAADDQGGGAGGVSLDDLAQARGRADDNGQVHAGFARTHDASQARGAELEGAVHGGTDTGERFLVPAPRVLKVIIESAALSDNEIIAACMAAKAAGADFVKTSTGFHPAGGASTHAVTLMRATVGDALGVKASGGIRDAETALAMINAGASRLGVSATNAILAGLED